MLGNKKWHPGSSADAPGETAECLEAGAWHESLALATAQTTNRRAEV